MDDAKATSGESGRSYKRLFLNTLTFAIGSFGSKLLVLILVPLYTSSLTPGEYGTVDLITQTANLLIPIFTLTVSEAALRFGLDARELSSRREVYTLCLRILTVGLFALLLVMPAISMLGYLEGYAPLLYIYVWTSSLRQLNMTFVRAVEKVRLFALDGVLCTLTMLLLNILFLPGLKLGILGYLLAIILSDALSSVFLFFAGGLYRFVGLKIDRGQLRPMLKYCVPMIPATVLWLVTSVSDHFMVTYFHGEELNGILVVAYKIPMILTTVFTMFSQAWNMSAISENSSSERERFYTDIFSMSCSFMFILAAGILLFIKPVLWLWVDGEYFIAYKYAPILTVATVFTCFNVFLGSVYIAQKKTKHTFYTSLAAGLSNIVLNLLMIPRFGIFGAATATLISYLGAFLYRLIDTRRLIRFDYSRPRLIISTLLILIMSVIVALDFSAGLRYGLLAALFLAVTAVNIGELIRVALIVAPERIKNRLKPLGRLISRQGGLEDKNGRA